MKTTSHFLWLEMEPEIFSDIFVEIYNYLKENNIENIVEMQNPLSPHITLYYFEKEISQENMQNIQENIKKLDVSKEIFLMGIDYFYRNNNRFICYFTIKTEIPLERYRNIFHKKYNRVEISDNSLVFSPHITFLRILNNNIFERHRESLEKIIFENINNIKNKNIFSWKIFLYRVNSKFPWEIQLKYILE